MESQDAGSNGGRIVQGMEQELPCENLQGASKHHGDHNTSAGRDGRMQGFNLQHEQDSFRPLLKPRWSGEGALK